MYKENDIVKLENKEGRRYKFDVEKKEEDGSVSTEWMIYEVLILKVIKIKDAERDLYTVEVISADKNDGLYIECTKSFLDVGVVVSVDS